MPLENKMDTLLIIGLGNPGRQYTNTWHNLGFAVIDALHKDALLTSSPWSDNKKFSSLLSESLIDGKKILLAKPVTFMNRSGITVKSLATFFKIATENIWIIHDDIDLPVGKIRISRNSSSGGHNGVLSVIQELGNSSFVRFRIGIATPARKKIPTEKYVLKKIPIFQRLHIKKSIAACHDALLDASKNGVEYSMNTYN